MDSPEGIWRYWQVWKVKIVNIYRTQFMKLCKGFQQSFLGNSCKGVWRSSNFRAFVLKLVNYHYSSIEKNWKVTTEKAQSLLGIGAAYLKARCVQNLDAS